MARHGAAPAHPGAHAAPRSRAAPAGAARDPGVLREDGDGDAAGTGRRLRQRGAIAPRSGFPRALLREPPPRRPRANHLRGQHAQGQRKAQCHSARSRRRHRLPDAGGRRSGGDHGVDPPCDRGSAGGGQRDLAPEGAQPLAARHRAVQGPVRCAQAPGPRRRRRARDHGGLHGQLGFSRPGPARLWLRALRARRRRVAADPRQRRAHLRRERDRRGALLHGAAAADGRGLMARARLAIRRGGPRDVPVILALIRGLAEYERLAHQVEATPARLKRHGFGRRPYFETLICRRGRRPVGFALFFFTYSTFLARPSLYLEDLFVLPEERGKGAGKALLRALAKIAVARGCGRMEWAVLDWNTPSIRFYKALGAKLRKEWVLTRLTGPALRRLGR